MKRTGLILLLTLSWVTVSCENILPPSEKDACSAEQVKLLDKVEKGDLQALKNYLENGGDPAMNCVDSYSSGGHYGSGYARRELYSSVIISGSGSDKLLEYYLSYNLPSVIKDEMLNSFAGDSTHAAIAQLLVDKGAHITVCADRCIGEDISGHLMRNLHAFGYDFNWKDPTDGNTLFMKYALCPGEGDEQEVIAMMKLLIELGAKADVKNNKGKTALDIAVNPEVRKYLKTL